MVKDGATSVIWGMLGAVGNADLAHCVLTLGRIPRRMLRAVRGQHWGTIGESALQTVWVGQTQDHRPSCWKSARSQLPYLMR
jgi:hypothetical protein